MQWLPMRAMACVEVQLLQRRSSPRTGVQQSGPHKCPDSSLPTIRQHSHQSTNVNTVPLHL